MHKYNPKMMAEWGGGGNGEKQGNDIPLKNIDSWY
jgi:hypothetical protein